MMLREDVPGSMRALVRLFTGIGVQDGWKELEYCVRTGEPAFRLTSPDADPFTQLHKDPEQAAIFDKAMATFAPQTSAAVAAAYDFSAFGKLADIGGGNGALLVGILKANPRLRGVVFDLPDVAERAKENIAAAGIADRCEVVAGSFFERVAAGADAYLLKHVIHDWNDERAAAILRNCRAAMPPHGQAADRRGRLPRADRPVACLPRRGGQRREHAGLHGRATAVRGGVPRAVRGGRFSACADHSHDRASVCDRGRARLKRPLKLRRNISAVR